jgi:hypothetical protein
MQLVSRQHQRLACQPPGWYLFEYRAVLKCQNSLVTLLIMCGRDVHLHRDSMAQFQAGIIRTRSPGVNLVGSVLEFC